MNRILRLAATSLLLTLVPGAALADDPPAKRKEGRYFVEAAEIMLRANDFDTLIASVSPDGNSAATDEVAELSKWNLDQPKMTLGLNRPGKTSLQVTVHDFELSKQRIPNSFEDGEDQVVTTPYLPPGIVFQRQRTLPTGGGATAEEFTPNWMEEYGYIHRIDYRSFDFALHRTAYENTRFRFRWIAGIRYAQLQQKTSFRAAFAEESNGGSTTTLRDFFNVQAQTQTHGIGPHLGLAARLLAGGEKKWAFNAQVDVAMLPESTNTSYALSLVDASAEYVLFDTDPDPNNPPVYVVLPNTERPVMPGLGSDIQPGSTFNAVVRQSDFTENTFLVEGTVGVQYSITKSISMGIEGWHMTWMNLLTVPGLVDQIHEEATYEVVEGDPNAVDPQLQETESVIHVPRFDRRDDVSFDGVSFNLRFEF